jgi:hypothetical protein
VSQPEFAFHRQWWWDPIDMEHILRDIELEEEQKARLIATSLQTLAAVHGAIAEGAQKAAEQLGSFRAG